MPKFTIEINTEDKVCSINKNGAEIDPDGFSLGRFVDYDGRKVCYVSYMNKDEDGERVTRISEFSEDSDTDATTAELKCDLPTEMGNVLKRLKGRIALANAHS
jgi:hypothetical protein